MKSYRIAFCSISLLYSCVSAPNKPAPPAEDTLTTTAAPATKLTLSGCYEMSVGKDTAYMQLQQTGDSVSGPLLYKRFEKDSNTGVVTLKVKADKAEGWYKFQSEGKTTYRQIAFRLTNNMLAEAYGDIAMKGDTAIFKYPATLAFEEKHPFTKITCK